MGLFDTIRTVLGTTAEADATRDADPEDLFGMSTAYVTMEADLGFRSVDAAALCFSGVDSTDFSDVVDDVEAILRAGEEETGTAFELHEDSHGWEWVILRDDDPEDLVTSVHFAADEFIERGYGSRLLAAVFGFERAGGGRGTGGSDDRTDGDADRAYWIYSFRRGAYYPFAPKPGKARNQQLEFKLESVLDGELGLEDDESYWYPMWSDRDGGHPWE
ncbi:PspA-associated protein PspAB [Halobellus salinisoli]|uniref:PspA-associated protein PspAB n=1 Tax=Halobellus salinisoli TaxID=3108500 RepID=UPI00300B69DA